MARKVNVVRRTYLEEQRKAAMRRRMAKLERDAKPLAYAMTRPATAFDENGFFRQVRKNKHGSRHAIRWSWPA